MENNNQDFIDACLKTMSSRHKLGDVVSLDFNSVVNVDIDGLCFEGIIVGKSSNDINQCHIVKCTDNTLPTEEYKYDTISVPAVCIHKKK